MPSLSTPVSSTTYHFVFSSFVYCCFVYSTFLLLLSVVSHTQLKFNMQFNVLWNILLVIHTYKFTYIQVYNFLNPTQLLSVLIYSCKEYSLFENFSWIVFSLFSFCLSTHLVGLTTPPAASCSKDTSVAACCVLNSLTISYLFGWLFPTRRLILLCHPSTWLFVLAYPHCTQTTLCPLSHIVSE